MLIALFLLLICFPALFNGILERAGFTEGSLIVLNAGIQMEQMQQRLDSISKKLVTLSATTNDPAVEHITQSINSSKAQLNLSNITLKEEVQFQQKKLNTIFKDAPVITPKN